jgi:hypothetical protein
VVIGWVIGWVACTCAWAAPASARAHPDGVESFGTKATATPVRIELYEPTIPVPASPQGELNFSFTHVEASSGPAGRARASLLWPGGPIGEGLPTFATALGFPKELFAAGYPVQVNATSPGDQTHDRQEPLPGSVQRVSSGPRRTIAKAGFSSSSDIADQDPAAEGGGPLDGIGGGSLPNVGDLLSNLTHVTDSLTGGGTDKPDDSGDDSAGGGSPLGALAAVVNVGGMTSTSTTSYGGDQVVATAESKIGGLELLGGIVKIAGVKVMTTSTADLTKAESKYVVSYTGLTIAGVPFSIGKDGIVVPGKKVPIPGLPDNPAKALETLGISFELPQARRTDNELSSRLAIQGLKITLDLKLLRPLLSQLPFDKLADLIPAEGQAAQLKSLIGALGGLSPKVVVYLGNADTEATAVPPIELPSTPTGPTTGGGTPKVPVAGGGAGIVSSPPVGTGNVPVVSVPPAEIPLVTLAKTPGLPDLGTIPALLLVCGLGLGAGAGFWLRRIGVLALGVGSTCSHGLVAGLPDLREIGS